jgi:alcohol dehydrogenase (cytochrome c)
MRRTRLVMKRPLIISSLLLVPALLFGQGGLDPAAIFKPLGAPGMQWPTYSGDYSGKRFSPLKDINKSTVKNLSLAWVTRLTQGCGATGGADTSGIGGSGTARLIVGGLGNGDLNPCGTVKFGGSVLMVDGVAYISSPDNAWSVDARDGTVL